MREMIEMAAQRMSKIDPVKKSLLECHREFSIILKSLPDQRYQRDFMRGYLELLAQYDGDFVDGLFGVKKVEENRDSSISCFSYQFGLDVNIMDQTQEMLNEWSIADQNKSGSYALYLARQGYPTHVGRVIEGGEVISKWGPYRPVYKHSPWMVPLSYGPTIIYRYPLT